jgi:hypothetical protein
MRPNDSKLRRLKTTKKIKILLWLLVVTSVTGLMRQNPSRPRKTIEFGSGGNFRTSAELTLVTMAYAEGLGNGGEIDLHNLRYFLKVGVAGVVPGTKDENHRVEYNLVVSGRKCTPCEDTLPQVLKLPTLRNRRHGWFTVLSRKNFGMDFGAFNTSLEWVKQKKPHRYKYFVFINSSLRGPFMPKWTPNSFHFTDALTQYLKQESNTKLAGSYITCLPTDEPSPGPIVESLFFAVNNISLSWLIMDGIFKPKDTKYETALESEYSLATSILSRGGRLDGLSSRYAVGIDWSNRVHHHCNDNRHSSRRGSLEGGISPNPFEHIFLKTSWCVRSAESAVLSRWFLRLSSGSAGTKGAYDRGGYLRGISIDGTSGKAGTLPLDVPYDSCSSGKIKSLFVSPGLAQ